MTDPKNFFHSNLRFLRERKHYSQEELAEELGLTRSKLQALESGKTVNPIVDDLIKISGYFKLSIDALLKINLSRLSELKLRDLEAGNDVYITGGKLRVLAITADAEGRENVEFVPVKAKAGYVAGYNDPDFISSLPRFNMPQLPKNKTFRMFPITGDSMLPFKDGDCIIAEYVQDWHSVKDETFCIVILKEAQDFVFKRVTNRLREDRELTLSSLNDLYKPYTVKANDILELWQYHSYWTKNIHRDEPVLEEVLNHMNAIQQLLNPIKGRG